MLARTTLAALAAAIPLAAQNDYDFDKTSPCRLGGVWSMQVQNAPPSQFILYCIASNGGPLPLSLIDPADPRQLLVGVDLVDFWTLGITSPGGTGSFALNLPLVPAYAGIEAHAQSVMLLFGATLFGQLGNDVIGLAGMPDVAGLSPSLLGSPRAFATSFADRNNNAGQGDVLIAGGGAGSLTGATGLATSELWDFRHGRVLPGPTMTSARALHVAVPLLDGRVLVIGGANAVGVTLASCELYDPATNSFVPTASMATPRVLHAACRLADGRVMVAGGTATLQPDINAAAANALASCEIWNPATGTWSATAAIGAPRLAPALSLLSNNQVMVSGGLQPTFFLGILTNIVSTPNAQRWNPASGTWTSGPNMPQGRAGHHYNQVTLADGRLLLAGGVNVPGLLSIGSTTSIAGADLYNPATNSWQSTTMPNARALHGATRLPDGRVAVTGGAQLTINTTTLQLVATPTAAVDVFYPAANLWAPFPSLSGPRASHAAELLPDGSVLLFGGQGAVSTLNTIEQILFQ